MDSAGIEPAAFPVRGERSEPVSYEPVGPLGLSDSNETLTVFEPRSQRPERCILAKLDQGPVY